VILQTSTAGEDFEPQTGPSPARRQWCQDPHLKSVPPHFTFGPSVAAYIQYCI